MPNPCAATRPRRSVKVHARALAFAALAGTLPSAFACIFDFGEPAGSACAPYTWQQLDLDEEVPAGFSGRRLLTIVEGAPLLRVRWTQESSETQGAQQILIGPDTRFAIELPDPEAIGCDAEFGEAEIAAQLQWTSLEQVGPEPPSSRGEAKLRPLMGAGELSAVSLDVPEIVWPDGPYAGEPLRLRMRIPAPPSRPEGGLYGTLYLPRAICGPSPGETGSVCEDEAIAEIIGIEY